MIARLHVAFVGGVRKVERELISYGEALGVAVEVHDGHTSGNGTTRLAALVQRSDVLVIVTGTNSHNAVHIAKREAAKSRASVRILKSCGASTARALLAEVAAASGGAGSTRCRSGGGTHMG